MPRQGVGLHGVDAQWPERWRGEPDRIDTSGDAVKAKSFLYGNPSVVDPSKSVYIGIDPGTKIGVAALCSGIAVLFWIDSSKLLWPDRGLWMLDTLPKLIMKQIRIDLGTSRKQKFVACIERAAYGKQYGQVALAEHRAAIQLGFEKAGIKTISMPPQTIRKEVFGHGRIKASEVWTHIPEDAADALACAYYLYKIQEG